MKEALLYGHLGLGDMLIMNGLVRVLAKRYDRLTVLCKRHNAESARFQWKEVENVTVFDVKDDDEAEKMAKTVEYTGHEVLKLGDHRQEPWDRKIWDQEFYRQADVAFKERWDSFHVMRQHDREFELEHPIEEYVLVHPQASFGEKIDMQKLPFGIPAVEVGPKPRADGLPPNIFDWIRTIQNAREIHCVESSFAVLVDSLDDLKAAKLVLHEYCRQSIPPAYRKNWTRVATK